MAPKILIFGAGSIGAGYAYVLLRNLPSENVIAVCRSNFDVASQHGFKMDSTIFGTDLAFKPVVVQTVGEAAALDKSTPFDYVLVTSKVLRESPPVTELIKPAVSEDTTIVLIQNGIAIEEEYAKVYPRNPILSVVVYFAVTQIEPAVLKHSEIELLHVGTYPASAPPDHKRVAESFVQLITDCGATAKLHDDVQHERWAKLMMNAPLNPICALSRLRDTQFLHTGDGASELMRDAMSEIVSIARAYGYTNVGPKNIEVGMGRMQTRSPPGVQPSMMADVLAGKNMEVEAIVGNAFRLAREKNVHVPVLRTIYMLIRALDQSLSQP